MCVGGQESDTYGGESAEAVTTKDYSYDILRLEEASLTVLCGKTSH